MEVGLDGIDWGKRTQFRGTCNDPEEKSERTGLAALVKVLALAREKT